MFIFTNVPILLVIMTNKILILTFLIIFSHKGLSQSSNFNFMQTKIKQSTFSKEIKKTNLCKKQTKITEAIQSSLPTSKVIITSKYGYRLHPIKKTKRFHYGIDIKTNLSNIYSVLDGIVVKTEYDKKLGYYVKIKHKGIFTIYGHLSKILVNVNDKIKSGDIIGISGKTGLATGDHLHFAIKYKNKYINPEILINRIKKGGLI